MFFKIYTSSWYFVFHYEKKYLYIFRGSEPRVFFKSKNLSPFLRGKDRFLDLFRFRLRNKRLEKVILHKDFVELILFKGRAYFFWTKKGLHFAFDFEEDNFCSWTKKKFSLEEFKKFSLLPLVNEELDEDLAFEKFNKKISLKKKYLEDLKQGLSNLEDGLALKNKLLKDEISLEGSVFKFKKLKISFKKEDSYYQKRNKVFEKIKGYEKKKKIVLEKIEKIENKKEILKKLPMEQPYWDRSGEIIYDHEKFFMIIGQDEEENMKIFNKYKKKKDFLFFHLKDQSSAFGLVFLKESENLEMAVKKYLEMIHKNGPVLIASIKNVQLKKNGKVLVKKYEVRS